MHKTLTFSMVSNTGGRPVNEDAIGAFQGENTAGFILCDGLGGHGMGDKASELVKEVFLDCLKKIQKPGSFSAADLQATTFYEKTTSENMDLPAISSLLPTSFTLAQEALLAEQKRLNAESKMKTTAVAFVTDGKMVYIGHVGDSRLYIFRRNKVKFRTLDHSVPQMLVKSCEIKESEIRNHPDRNRLLRALGLETDRQLYELQEPYPLRKCQAFLLCSDGFWELIEEEKMCSFLKKAESADEWLRLMNEEVQKNGAGKNMDNNSAIAVWWS